MLQGKHGLRFITDGPRPGPGHHLPDHRPQQLRQPDHLRDVFLHRHQEEKQRQPGQVGQYVFVILYNILFNGFSIKLTSPSSMN